ncbi:YjjG family noncanonical pyrimidine nucleotidase [Polaribacter sp.]|jgi:putative hydrolase of the HAD superfamily|uniref:YjjG family noncanonical pyrimidine nucleotidase n=1 Tax=Polaribacter sp. TaxID=1920175 RepID=UPI004048CBFB
MKIEHIFFDLDHTLWDFEKNSDLTFHKLFEKHAINTNLSEFLSVYKPLNKEFWKLYRDEKISKEDLRYQRLKRAFDMVHYPISDELIHVLAIEYIEYLPEFSHLFDHTFEILTYLKEKYELHIITNGFEEIQTKKMDSSKISHFFSRIITSDSVHVKKPNPKVFYHALEVANATIENSIMIGDSIEADIEGALQVGMQAIHCNFEGEEIVATNFRSIKSLLEIKQYL